MSTSWIKDACSSMARASDTVRFGRRMISANSTPLAKLNGPARWIVMMFGPMVLIALRSDSSKPRIIAVMPTIEVMPITTPSTVSPERILFVRTVSNAMAMTSANRLALIFETSLSPQSLDRIQPGGPRRRIQSEEQPDDAGDADAEGNRPCLDGGRNRGQRRDHHGDRRAEEGADHAAERRQHH